MRDEECTRHWGEEVLNLYSTGKVQQCNHFRKKGECRSTFFKKVTDIFSHQESTLVCVALHGEHNER